MSTCISGGCGGTYKFDLDIVKPPSPSSPSTARASSQTCSSTLSESSNDSPLALSTKRARAPRKRPNQTYTEAAALLSSIYPNVFTTKDFKTLCKHTKEAPFDDPPEPPLLLPLPLPPLDGHGFLLDKPTVFDKPNSPIELKRPNLDTQTSFEEAVIAPSDDEEEDYFGSILDEGVGEGIDSILGDISTDNLNWNPLGLGPFGFGRRFECGLGLRRALRRPSSANVNNGFVRMLDIVTPKFETQTPLEKNGKKKKKKAKRESEAEDPLKGVTVSADETGNSNLKLKLNFEGVLKEWSGSAFSDESSGDAVARLAQIDLFGDTRNSKDEREASVLRYKEKRRTRLFSKKIRYQVRKLNADHRPRIKGRFVRRPNHSCSVDEEERELVS